MMRRSIALVLTGLFALTGCGPSEPKTTGAPPTMRRLTEDQYRHSIADIFGADIVVGGRFDPLIRVNGLLAVGASTTGITSLAAERYDSIARAIATQVVDKTNRDTLVQCKPAAVTGPDDACANQFLGRVGRLIFRRSLTSGEIATSAAIANAAATKLGDFYAGLATSLSVLLVSPEFLFIADTTTPDPSQPSGLRLTSYAKASRLSFLLWNTTPDDVLLTAAESGEIDTAKGLEKQVDRMLSSSRVATGVRSFFSDMLGFDAFETLQKDPVIYPAFGLATIEDAREQTLRTITDLLVDHNADYRDIFTTRKTFLTGALGLIYRVPVSEPDGWAPYEFPEGDQHVGIQSHVGFAALYAHPGRSSATLRGKAVREVLMCQKVPDPPSNVDFTLVSDSTNPVYKTARARLGAHATEATCAGCHRIMDPIGLTLENFDGAGQWRMTENGVAIDTSGEIDGTKYTDAAGLAAALHNNPAVTECLINRIYAYATGHVPKSDEKPVLRYFGETFADDGFRMTKLLRRLALSEAFYVVAPPDAREMK